MGSGGLPHGNRSVLESMHSAEFFELLNTPEADINIFSSLSRRDGAGTAGGIHSRIHSRTHRRDPGWDPGWDPQSAIVLCLTKLKNELWHST